MWHRDVELVSLRRIFTSKRMILCSFQHSGLNQVLEIQHHHVTQYAKMHRTFSFSSHSPLETLHAAPFSVPDANYTYTHLNKLTSTTATNAALAIAIVYAPDWREPHRNTTNSTTTMMITPIHDGGAKRARALYETRGDPRQPDGEEHICALTISLLGAQETRHAISSAMPSGLCCL